MRDKCRFWCHLHRSPARLWPSGKSHPRSVRKSWVDSHETEHDMDYSHWTRGIRWHFSVLCLDSQQSKYITTGKNKLIVCSWGTDWGRKAGTHERSNNQGITWHTSSNMTLIVSTVEYWAAIWLSTCSDRSRISPILSVLMMEWCLVRSRCSSWTWSFRFWISVWKVYKHTQQQQRSDECADAKGSASECENFLAHLTGWRGNHAAAFFIVLLQRIRHDLSSRVEKLLCSFNQRGSEHGRFII